MNPIDTTDRTRCVAPAECTVTVCSQLPAWGDYLWQHPQATVFHNPRWGLVMARAYGSRPHYLTAWRGGQVAGVLQLVEQRSMLFGSHLCSLPYFDASGIVADDQQARQELLSAGAKLNAGLGADWAELRQESPVAGDVPCRTDKVALRLPLPGGPQELWSSLPGKVRNQIRKAQRDELTCCQGGEELLHEFHDVYCRNMRDLGSPPHGKQFFLLATEEFCDQARLFVVRSGRQALAASLTFFDGRRMHVTWAGSDWRARGSCANMLLYWSMLSEACRGGASWFDFGRSSQGSGTHRFKAQWGAQESPLYWHYLLRGGAGLPELRPDGPRYRFLTACWRRLPVGLARALGPGIIGKLT